MFQCRRPFIVSIVKRELQKNQLLSNKNGKKAAKLAAFYNNYTCSLMVNKALIVIFGNIL